jgi:Zn-dependent protease
MSPLIFAGFWYLIFLFSLVCHEAAHSWAAMRLGDDTAFEGGQVSLDPMPHIKQEPFGTVVVPILTYMMNGWMMGWASAPYDPRWAWTFPKRAAWMSAAGPLANLMLVVISGMLIRLGMLAGVFYPPESIDFTAIVLSNSPGPFFSAALFLSIMFSLNLLLFVFNLLPIPPLDGSGVIPLFLNEDSARKYLEFIHNPSFMIIGIILAWNIMDFFYYPVYTMFLNILYLGAVGYS